MDEVQVVIVGAGFSGITAAVRLKRDLGVENFIIYDQSPAIGGTWQANTYPGCGVDVPGPMYSLSFAPNPLYTTLLPSQSEILRYLNTIVDKFDIRRHVQLGIAFENGQWSEESQSWVVKLRSFQTGEVFTRECKILISAIGNLVHPNFGSISGIKRFSGPVIHTGKWDHSVNLEGKRVIVIGNGCSATQLIPAIADTVHSLHQFSRSVQTYRPSYNPVISPYWQWIYGIFPILLKLYRWVFLILGDIAFAQYRLTPRGNTMRARATVRCVQYVKEEAPLEYWNLLLPSYEKGCKRVIRDHEYLSTLHKPNIHLIGEAVKTCTSEGVFTDSGQYFPADIIILATGFDTSKNKLSLIGRESVSLDEHWKRFGGAEAYKTVAMSGFPNFFILYGPNGAFAHTSALFAIENAVSLVLKVAKPVLLKKQVAVEIDFEEEWLYNKVVTAALKSTVWEGCSSYYRDAAGRNIFLYPWNAMTMYLDMNWESLTGWRYGNTNSLNRKA